MPLRLRFQSTGSVPGTQGPAEMLGKSMTIGRGNENDLVLPDPDRMVSTRHCAIEDHNGNIIIIDISTNGTFLNYSKIPLGNVPTPLNDGDVLSIGTYELVVDMGGSAASDDPMAGIAAPVGEGPVSHGQAGNAPNTDSLLDNLEGGDFLNDLLGEPGAPAGPRDLIEKRNEADEVLPPFMDDDDPFLPPLQDNAPEVTGASHQQHSPSASDAFSMPSAQKNQIPDDWDLDIGAPETPSAPPPPTPGDETDPFAIPPAATPPPAPPVATPPPATAAPAPVPAPQNTDALAAFFTEMGFDMASVPQEELPETMARLGGAMRAMIGGLREVLMTRAAIKSEFRMNQTMIGAGGNNPLKFSVSEEQAIEAMVRPTVKGYLDADKAAIAALKDIKAHEVAMMTGMEAALKGLLKKLDPEVLGEKIEETGGLGNLLKGKKARYWEVYEKMYADISDQAENDFQDLFSNEFARAYDAQFKKL